MPKSATSFVTEVVVAGQVSYFVILGVTAHKRNIGTHNWCQTHGGALTRRTREGSGHCILRRCSRRLLGDFRLDQLSEEALRSFHERQFVRKTGF